MRSSTGCEPGLTARNRLSNITAAFLHSMPPDRTSSDVGTKLRAARERRGISLRQIANATKISIAALEALERNDISRLPGGIFSRAFVRSYASEVGLDPEATIQEFIAQFPNDAAVTAGHPTSDREDHTPVDERQGAGAFLWLLGISVPVAAGLFYFTSSGRTSARPATRSEPVVPLPALQVETPAVAPASASSPEAAATGTAPRPAVERAATDASRPTGPAGTTAVLPSPGAAGAARAAAADDRLTIELVVKRPCWGSATVDGRRSIERLLQAGERQTIEVRREMVLTAGDAAAIALTFNGAE